MLCSCLNADHGVGGLMWVKTAPAVIPCNNTLFCADCKAAAASAVRTDSRCLLCVKCEGSSRRRSSSWIFFFFCPFHPPPPRFSPPLPSRRDQLAGNNHLFVSPAVCQELFFFFFALLRLLLSNISRSCYWLKCVLLLIFFNADFFCCFHFYLTAMSICAFKIPYALVRAGL